LLSVTNFYLELLLSLTVKERMAGDTVLHKHSMYRQERMLSSAYKWTDYKETDISYSPWLILKPLAMMWTSLA